MANDQAPSDYSEPFRIEGPVGNNALSYARRGPSPHLWVPSLVSGTLADVVPGNRVVFEDFDEHGTLQSCTGLAHIVATTWKGTPTVVMDNHNHAFYFWFEAFMTGHLQPGATLVHLDQHRDTRTPALAFDEASTLSDAFRYTNFHLNVGNYIVPASQAGLIDEILLVTGEDDLHNLTLAGRGNTILNIDLDFFAPAMSYVDFTLARRFINAHVPSASLITVATSPFFIDQPRAIARLRELAGA
jgi:hypothetical protein